MKWLDRLNTAFWVSTAVLLLSYLAGFAQRYLLALVLFLAPFGIGTGFEPNLNTKLARLKGPLRQERPYYLIGFAVIVLVFWAVALWVLLTPESVNY